jgi:hypothetical protein
MMKIGVNPHSKTLSYARLRSALEKNTELAFPTLTTCQFDHGIRLE